jgi:DNA-binding CsgD family transcriptional regulator
MAKREPISKETKALIREQVLKGKSKSQVARDFNLTFRTVWNHTKDIRTQKLIPKKIKEKIRKDVINGKSKYQTAKEYNLSNSTVYNITKDLFSKSNGGWSGIRGKTLDLLQEIIAKGYASSSYGYTQQRYMVLRKYFPTICRKTIYGKTIFYLKGKEDAAVRAFLENTRKKIISYQELRQVTEVFGTDLTIKEKEAFLFKKQGNRGVKNHGVQKRDFHLLDLDSFSFFYIRKY